MLRMGIKIKTRGWVPGTRRAIAGWHKAKRVGHRAMAQHWHGRPRAMRFTPHAYSILDYHGRSPRKIKVNPLPFVWTGDTKRQSKNVKITATYKSAVLRYSLPALNFRPKGWDHTMREEWERIAPDEPQAVADVGAAKITQTLRKLGMTGGVTVERITW